MQYLAVFFTHSGAIKYQRWLKAKDINCELLPVPRQISSSCGLAAQFVLEGDCKDYINEDIERLYQVTPEGYKLIYQAE